MPGPAHVRVEQVTMSGHGQKYAVYKQAGSKRCTVELCEGLDHLLSAAKQATSITLRGAVPACESKMGGDDIKPNKPSEIMAYFSLLGGMRRSLIRLLYCADSRTSLSCSWLQRRQYSPSFRARWLSSHRHYFTTLNMPSYYFIILRSHGLGMIPCNDTDVCLQDFENWDWK